jgi:hypothetical protein
MSAIVHAPSAGHSCRGIWSESAREPGVRSKSRCGVDLEAKAKSSTPAPLSDKNGARSYLAGSTGIEVASAA